MHKFTLLRLKSGILPKPEGGLRSSFNKCEIYSNKKSHNQQSFNEESIFKI